MNNTAFYQGILYELKKQANTQPMPAPQPIKKKPWYSTPLGMGAIAGGLGLAGYGLNHMANKGMDTPYVPPKPTDFSETPSDSFMGKTTQGINDTAGGLIGDIAKPWQSPWMMANAFQKQIPFGSKIVPGLNRGVMGLNGLSMMSDALDSKNDMGAGYKALQFGGGGVDAGAQLLGKNLLTKGFTAAAKSPLLSRSLTSAAPGAAEAIGGRAAGALLGGPAIGATVLGTAGQMALQHGTESAEDYVNQAGDNSSWLEKAREGLKSYNPETQNKSLNNLYGWFRSPEGQNAQNAMTNPSAWARFGGNTHFWKNPSGAGDLSSPVYQHLNDRAYHEYMAKIKELGIKEPVYPTPPPPPQQEITGLYDSSPIY